MSVDRTELSGTRRKFASGTRVTNPYSWPKPKAFTDGKAGGIVCHGIGYGRHFRPFLHP